MVTSGAIGVGLGRLGLRQRPSDIGSLQAVAAVGQNLLMNAYEQAFREQGIVVAQMLVTADDLHDRKRYVNFSNALHALFRYNVVPIINENDTVAVEEIRVGDNDTLSAHVANASEADLLILLTDTDGVYTADPHRHPEAQRIPLIERITPEIRALGEQQSPPDRQRIGTGQLRTKLQAAEIATGAGIPVVLAHGRAPEVLPRILNGEELGTFFLPYGPRTSRRKRWIAFARAVTGRLFVDEGAYRAIVQRGTSLLPAGVLRVEGTFEFGDTVSVCTREGVEFARGLVNYSADEVRRLAGKRTYEIESVLGYRYADEVVHRDNLFVFHNGAVGSEGDSAHASQFRSSGRETR